MSDESERGEANTIAVPEEGVPREKWLRVGPAWVRDVLDRLAAADREREAADALAAAIEAETAAQAAYDAHSGVYEWNELVAARKRRRAALAHYRATRGAP